MAAGRDFDRHSWCGAFAKSAAMREPSLHSTDLLLPVSVLQLDPADRAVLRIADVRDAVQKKTFTKWVNKHLIRVQCLIQDLFEDLRDGWLLISLLEVLAHKQFPRARGRMRCHQIQNVQTVLDYLRHKRIKVVNIRADEIVDGNPKLTLGLIWTFILHFQVGDVIVTGQTNDSSVREALLLWCQRMVEGYRGIHVNDFTKSWTNGLAFLAILHRHRPDLIDMTKARKRPSRENLKLAFDIAENVFGVTRLLDQEDFDDLSEPDERSVLTYVSSLYDRFPHVPTLEQSLQDNERLLALEEYHDLAAGLRSWLTDATSDMLQRHFPSNLTDLKLVQSEFNRFRVECVPSQLRTKQRLVQLFDRVQDLSAGTPDVITKDNFLHIDNISRMWDRFATAQQDRDLALQAEITRAEQLQRLADKLTRECQTCEGHVTSLRQRLNQENVHSDRMSDNEATYLLQTIGHTLGGLDACVRGMMTDIKSLRDREYHKADQLYSRIIAIKENVAQLKNLRDEWQKKLSDRSAALRAKEMRVLTDDRTSSDLLDNIERLMQCIQESQSELNRITYGSDIESVTLAVEQLTSLQQDISSLKHQVSRCLLSRGTIRIDSARTLNDRLSSLEFAYSQLNANCTSKHQSAESFLSFMSSALRLLKSLGDIEERLLSKGWGVDCMSSELMRQHLQNYQSELLSADIEVKQMKELGERLCKSRHPDSAAIQICLEKISTQRSWMDQLTQCGEVHQSNAKQTEDWKAQLSDIESWLSRHSKDLHSVQTHKDLSVEDGEKLLADMQSLQSKLIEYSYILDLMKQRSEQLAPLVLQDHISRLPSRHSRDVSETIDLLSLCAYRRRNLKLVPGESSVLVDSRGDSHWTVRSTTSGHQEGTVPAICVQIQPGTNGAAERALNSLQNKLEDLQRLWVDSQRGIRHKIILSTVDLIQSWPAMLDSHCTTGVSEESMQVIIAATMKDGNTLLSEFGTGHPSYEELQDKLRCCTDAAMLLQQKLRLITKSSDVDEDLTLYREDSDINKRVLVDDESQQGVLSDGRKNLNGHEVENSERMDVEFAESKPQRKRDLKDENLEDEGASRKFTTSQWESSQKEKKQKFDVESEEFKQKLSREIRSKELIGDRESQGISNASQLAEQLVQSEKRSDPSYQNDRTVKDSSECESNGALSSGDADQKSMRDARDKISDDAVTMSILDEKIEMTKPDIGFEDFVDADGKNKHVPSSLEPSSLENKDKSGSEDRSKIKSVSNDDQQAKGRLDSEFGSVTNGRPDDSQIDRNRENLNQSETSMPWRDKIMQDSDTTKNRNKEERSKQTEVDVQSSDQAMYEGCVADTTRPSKDNLSTDKATVKDVFAEDQSKPSGKSDELQNKEDKRLDKDESYIHDRSRGSEKLKDDLRFDVENNDKSDEGKRLIVTDDQHLGDVISDTKNGTTVGVTNGDAAVSISDSKSPSYLESETDLKNVGQKLSQDDLPLTTDRLLDNQKGKESERTPERISSKATEGSGLYSAHQVDITKVVSEQSSETLREKEIKLYDTNKDEDDTRDKLKLKSEFDSDVVEGKLLPTDTRQRLDDGRQKMDVISSREMKEEYLAKSEQDHTVTPSRSDEQDKITSSSTDKEIPDKNKKTDKRDLLPSSLFSSTVHDHETVMRDDSSVNVGDRDLARGDDVSGSEQLNKDITSSVDDELWTSDNGHLHKDDNNTLDKGKSLSDSKGSSGGYVEEKFQSDVDDKEKIGSHDESKSLSDVGISHNNVRDQPVNERDVKHVAISDSPSSEVTAFESKVPEITGRLKDSVNLSGESEQVNVSDNEKQQGKNVDDFGKITDEKFHSEELDNKTGSFNAANIADYQTIDSGTVNDKDSKHILRENKDLMSDDQIAATDKAQKVSVTDKTDTLTRGAELDVDKSRKLVTDLDKKLVDREHVVGSDKSNDFPPLGDVTKEKQSVDANSPKTDASSDVVSSVDDQSRDDAIMSTPDVNKVTLQEQFTKDLKTGEEKLKTLQAPSEDQQTSGGVKDIAFDKTLTTSVNAVAETDLTDFNQKLSQEQQWEDLREKLTEEFAGAETKSGSTKLDNKVLTPNSQTDTLVKGQDTLAKEQDLLETKLEESSVTDLDSSVVDSSVNVQDSTVVGQDSTTIKRDLLVNGQDSSVTKQDSSLTKEGESSPDSSIAKQDFSQPKEVSALAEHDSIVTEQESSVREPSVLDQVTAGTVSSTSDDVVKLQSSVALQDDLKHGDMNVAKTSEEEDLMSGEEKVKRDGQFVDKVDVLKAKVKNEQGRAETDDDLTPSSSSVPLSKILNNAMKESKMSQEDGEERNQATSFPAEVSRNLSTESRESFPNKVDSSEKQMSTAKAVGLGLLAVVGAPFIAGKAIVDALHNDDNDDTSQEDSGWLSSRNKTKVNQIDSSEKDDSRKKSPESGDRTTSVDDSDIEAKSQGRKLGDVTVKAKRDGKGNVVKESMPGDEFRSPSQESIVSKVRQDSSYKRDKEYQDLIDAQSESTDTTLSGFSSQTSGIEVGSMSGSFMTETTGRDTLNFMPDGTSRLTDSLSAEEGVRMDSLQNSQDGQQGAATFNVDRHLAETVDGVDAGLQQPDVLTEKRQTGKDSLTGIMKDQFSKGDRPTADDDNRDLDNSVVNLKEGSELQPSQTTEEMLAKEKDTDPLSQSQAHGSTVTPDSKEDTRPLKPAGDGQLSSVSSEIKLSQTSDATVSCQDVDESETLVSEGSSKKDVIGLSQSKLPFISGPDAARSPSETDESVTPRIVTTDEDKKPSQTLSPIESSTDPIVDSSLPESAVGDQSSDGTSKLKKALQWGLLGISAPVIGLVAGPVLAGKMIVDAVQSRRSRESSPSETTIDDATSPSSSSTKSSESIKETDTPCEKRTDDTSPTRLPKRDDAIENLSGASSGKVIEGHTSKDLQGLDSVNVESSDHHGGETRAENLQQTIDGSADVLFSSSATQPIDDDHKARVDDLRQPSSVIVDISKEIHKGDGDEDTDKISPSDNKLTDVLKSADSKLSDQEGENIKKVSSNGRDADTGALDSGNDVVDKASVSDDAKKPHLVGVDSQSISGITVDSSEISDVIFNSPVFTDSKAAYTAINSHIAENLNRDLDASMSVRSVPSATILDERDTKISRAEFEGQIGVSVTNQNELTSVDTSLGSNTNEAVQLSRDLSVVSEGKLVTSTDLQLTESNDIKPDLLKDLSVKSVDTLPESGMVDLSKDGSLQTQHIETISKDISIKADDAVLGIPTDRSDVTEDILPMAVTVEDKGQEKSDDSKGSRESVRETAAGQTLDGTQGAVSLQSDVALTESYKVDADQEIKKDSEVIDRTVVDSNIDQTHLADSEKGDGTIAIEVTPAGDHLHDKKLNDIKIKADNSAALAASVTGITITKDLTVSEGHMAATVGRDDAVAAQDDAAPVQDAAGAAGVEEDQSSDGTSKLKKALQWGLLGLSAPVIGLVAGPVLAGKMIVDAVQSRRSRESSPSERTSNDLARSPGSSEKLDKAESERIAKYNLDASLRDGSSLGSVAETTRSDQDLRESSTVIKSDEGMSCVGESDNLSLTEQHSTVTGDMKAHDVCVKQSEPTSGIKEEGSVSLEDGDSVSKSSPENESGLQITSAESDLPERSDVDKRLNVADVSSQDLLQRENLCADLNVKTEVRLEDGDIDVEKAGMARGSFQYDSDSVTQSEHDTSFNTAHDSDETMYTDESSDFVHVKVSVVESSELKVQADKGKISEGEDAEEDQTQGNKSGDVGEVSKPKTQAMSLPDALQSHIYDRRNNTFIDPKTGKRLNLIEAIQCGLIEGNDKIIADLDSGEVISIVQALERNIIDPATGLFLMDADTYGSLGDALDGGLIMDEAVDAEQEIIPSKQEPNSSLESYSLIEAIKLGIYDSKNNKVMEPNTGKIMTLVQALDKGLITSDSIMINDLSSGKCASFEMLLDMALIDLDRGIIKDSRGRDVSFEEAMDEGMLADERVVARPMKMIQLFDLGLYDALTGNFLDPETDEYLSLVDSIQDNLLDPQSVVVNDPSTQQVFSLGESIRNGLISGKTSYVTDTSTMEKISLVEAMQRGIVIPRPMSVVTAVDIGLYNEVTARFYDPTCGLTFALEEAIEHGLIDCQSLIVDPATGKAMAIAIATACGVLDARHGNVINMHTGQVISLKQMIEANRSLHVKQQVMPDVVMREERPRYQIKHLSTILEEPDSLHGSVLSLNEPGASAGDASLKDSSARGDGSKATSLVDISEDGTFELKQHDGEGLISKVKKESNLIQDDSQIVIAPVSFGATIQDQGMTVISSTSPLDSSLAVSSDQKIQVSPGLSVTATSVHDPSLGKQDYLESMIINNETLATQLAFSSDPLTTDFTQPRKGTDESRSTDRTGDDEDIPKVVGSDKVSTGSFTASVDGSQPLNISMNIPQDTLMDSQVEDGLHQPGHKSHGLVTELSTGFVAGSELTADLPSGVQSDSSQKHGEIKDKVSESRQLDSQDSSTIAISDEQKSDKLVSADPISFKQDVVSAISVQSKMEQIVTDETVRLQCDKTAEQSKMVESGTDKKRWDDVKDGQQIHIDKERVPGARLKTDNERLEGEVRKEAEKAEGLGDTAGLTHDTTVGDGEHQISDSVSPDDSSMSKLKSAMKWGLIGLSAPIVGLVAAPVLAGKMIVDALQSDKSEASPGGETQASGDAQLLEKRPPGSSELSQTSDSELSSQYRQDKVTLQHQLATSMTQEDSPDDIQLHMLRRVE